MKVSDLRGFKYPDIDIVRYFFKEGLDKKSSRVIEFGSNNGNNLSLFSSYGYEVIGIDLSQKNIENANFNFKNIYKFDKFNFVCDDMREFAKNHKNINAKIILVPNVINYITKDEFARFLRYLKDNKNIDMGGG